MTNRGTRTFAGKGKSQPADLSVVTFGLFSQRPPAGFPGRIFIATDVNNTMYVDSGNTATGWVQPGGTRLLAHSETQTSTSNSAAEIDLMNTTIAANTIVAGDMLRLSCYGGNFNSTGLATTRRIRFYVGGTLVADSTAAIAIGTGANWRPFLFDITVRVRDLNGTSWLSAYYLEKTTDEAEGAWGAATGNRIVGGPTGIAANWTTAVAIRLTMTMGAASASDFLRTDGYALERLPG
jgi:hypothetical protein